MAEKSVRLVLDETEVEVLEEALELYLRARPAAADHRYDYRYRAAQTVLMTLAQGQPEGDVDAGGDDEPLNRTPGGREGGGED